MTDRKKMINELTYQINSNEVMRQHYPVQLSVTDARKILELLKEQEKVKVVFSMMDTECGNCGCYLDKTYSVCPKCGKKVIDDEDSHD